MVGIFTLLFFTFSLGCNFFFFLVKGIHRLSVFSPCWRTGITLVEQPDSLCMTRLACQSWHTSQPFVRGQPRLRVAFSFKGSSWQLRLPETQVTGRKKQIHYQLLHHQLGYYRALTLLCCHASSVWATQYLVPGCPVLGKPTLNDLFTSHLLWIGQSLCPGRGTSHMAAQLKPITEAKSFETTLLSSLFCFFSVAVTQLILHFPAFCSFVSVACLRGKIPSFHQSD